MTRATVCSRNSFPYSTPPRVRFALIHRKPQPTADTAVLFLSCPMSWFNGPLSVFDCLPHPTISPFLALACLRWLPNRAESLAFFLLVCYADILPFALLITTNHHQKSPVAPRAFADNSGTTTIGECIQPLHQRKVLVLTVLQCDSLVGEGK